MYITKIIITFILEEILKTNNVIWWAPDGNYICFASINDTKVGSLHYNVYGNPSQNDTNSYPELFELRFPKVCKCA